MPTYRKMLNWLITILSEESNMLQQAFTISPLDLIIQKIKEAGYSVGEVTGRKLCVQYNSTNVQEHHRFGDE